MPSWTRRIWALFLGFVGCTPTVYTHDVPNLAQVDPGLNIWRGGQPRSADGWAYLKSLGIKRVVKLNFPKEGSDEGAVAIGLEVHDLWMQPEGSQDIWDEVAGTFVKPNAATITLALDVMAQGDAYVHCENGWDRTGITTAEWRRRRQGWSKDRAWDEMIAHGFHPELVGLTSFWNEDDDGVR